MKSPVSGATIVPRMRIDDGPLLAVGSKPPNCSTRSVSTWKRSAGSPSGFAAANTSTSKPSMVGSPGAPNGLGDRSMSQPRACVTRTSAPSASRNASSGLCTG
jgi:hypothetical protein